MLQWEMRCPDSLGDDQNVMSLNGKMSEWSADDLALMRDASMGDMQSSPCTILTCSVAFGAMKWIFHSMLFRRGHTYSSYDVTAWHYQMIL